MPIYEYYCPDNNRIYSFYAKTLAQGESVPKCPDNPDYRIIRMFSPFSVGGSRKKPASAEPEESGSAGVGDGFDDPRMAGAMAEMEREMGRMDPDNPDPRAMAQLMRRMSEMTGEKMDEGMEEMVRKMEEGQDPESLEEEMQEAFGDIDGDEDGGMGPMGGFGGAAPMRDPTLYDY